MERRRGVPEAPQSRVEERGGVKVVVKRYGAAPGFKWLPVGIAYRAGYPFALTPEARMRREVSFLEAGHEGFGVPRIVEADWESRVLVREYVEGWPLEPWRFEADAERLGEILARIHGEGWVMGDTKPTNFLEAPGGGLYVIDAEQAIRSGDPRLRGWDLLFAAVMVAAGSVLGAPVPGLPDAGSYGLVMRLVVDAYLDAGGDGRAVAEILSPRHAGLAVLIPVNMLVELRRLIKRVTRS